MGKLSILGAQRVKALQEILEQQKKAELATVKPQYPTNKEVYSALESDYPGITAAAELVKKVTGYNATRPYKSTPYDAVAEKLTISNQVERDAISAKYDDKARQLWLCETLEEAKAIVYGTPVGDSV